MRGWWDYWGGWDYWPLLGLDYWPLLELGILKLGVLPPKLVIRCWSWRFWSWRCWRGSREFAVMKMAGMDRGELAAEGGR
jgi:hypothetical protein